MRNLLDTSIIQPIFDGVKFGEPVMPCKISVLGEVDGERQVRAMLWDSATQSFSEYDHLEHATYTDNGGPTVTFTGTSTKLQNEMGLAGDQAQIEWRVDIRGCQGC